jgi:predicted Holliday junction resolvase-like endonuclease
MEAAIIAAVILAAVLVILLMNYITRLRYERKLREWQETETLKWQAEMEQARKSAVTQSRAVLGGRFTEQMAPYLPEFKYDPTEVRFIGSPVDLIIFPGLAQGDPREIVIMEIKSGKNPQLTPSEKRIRQLIEAGMVRWELLQRPAGEEIDYRIVP